MSEINVKEENLLFDLLQEQRAIKEIAESARELNCSMYETSLKQPERTSVYLKSEVNNSIGGKDRRKTCSTYR